MCGHFSSGYRPCGLFAFRFVSLDSPEQNFFHKRSKFKLSSTETVLSALVGWFFSEEQTYKLLSNPVFGLSNQGQGFNPDEKANSFSWSKSILVGFD